jgi:1-pyrroline-5-carboxylate dehydrogenase
MPTLSILPDIMSIRLVGDYWMITEFRNEPFTDFSVASNQEAMKHAIAKVKSQLGKTYPLVIGAEKIETSDYIIY